MEGKGIASSSVPRAKRGGSSLLAQRAFPLEATFSRKGSNRGRRTLGIKKNGACFRRRGRRQGKGWDMRLAERGKELFQEGMKRKAGEKGGWRLKKTTVFASIHEKVPSVKGGGEKTFPQNSGARVLS